MEEYNFSEEEEEQYAAAQDSQGEEDGGDAGEQQQLELSNITAFRDLAGHHASNTTPEPSAQAQPPLAFTFARHGMLQQDERPLVLFDLNGVLLHHQFDGRAHTHFLRPGVNHLLRLLPRFRLGVYTSATQKTVHRALAKLHGNLTNALQQARAERHPRFPAALPPAGIFELVLCRDHCVLASTMGAQRPGGKPWDTIKPLGRYFADLARVVLVDDSPHKSLPDEAGNMLIMPGWHGPDHPLGRSDGALPALVNALLEVTQEGGEGGVMDIRPALGEISRELLAAVVAAKAALPPAAEEEPANPDAYRPPHRLTSPAPMPGSAYQAAPQGNFGQQQGKAHGMPAWAPPPMDSRQWRAASPLESSRPYGNERGGLLREASPALSAGAAAPGLEHRGYSPVGHEAEQQLRRQPTPLVAQDHEAALRSLVRAAVRHFDGVSGVNALEVNCLLSERFPRVFATLLPNSARAALAAAAAAGVLACAGQGKRYRLAPGVVPPSEERLAQLEEQAADAAGGSAAGKAHEAAGAGPGGSELAVGAVGLLQQRHGVPWAVVDDYIMDELKQTPPLRGACFSGSAQPTKRLRNMLQHAKLACLGGSLKELEEVTVAGGSNHAALRTLRCTPAAPPSPPVRVALAEAAVALVPAMAVGRRNAAPPPPELGRSSAVGTANGTAPGLLPVFEGRGAASADAAPVAPTEAGVAGDAGASSTAAAAAAAAAGLLEPPQKKQKVQQGQGQQQQPEQVGRKASKEERQLQRMAEKLGLLPDCNLTKPQLKSLSKLAKKQKKRQARVQAEAASSRWYGSDGQGEAGADDHDHGAAEEAGGHYLRSCHSHPPGPFVPGQRVQQELAPPPGLGFTPPAPYPPGHPANGNTGEALHNRQAEFAAHGVLGGQPTLMRSLLAAAQAPSTGQPHSIGGPHHQPSPPPCEQPPQYQQLPQQQYYPPPRPYHLQQPDGHLAAAMPGGGAYLPGPPPPARPACGHPPAAPQNDATQQGAGLTALHHEVVGFAHAATPTQEEVGAVRTAVAAVEYAARAVWPHSTTLLFGSQATGLALPGSDLDIVVLGVGAELQRAGTGFTPVQRKALSEQLEDLLDALLKTGVVRGRAQIIEARVPIIKCCMDLGGPEGVAVDICIGAANGAAAVGFIRRQVLSVPPLRPLALVVKALLRDRGMGEVFTGGLGSYAVTNLVLAHLQAEGYVPDLPPPPGPPASASSRGGGRGGGKRKRGARERDTWDEEDSGAATDEYAAAAAAGGTFDFLHHLAARGLGYISPAQAGGLGYMSPAQAGGLGYMSPAQAARQQQQQQATGPGSPQADLGLLLWGFLERFGSSFDYGKQAVSIRRGGVAKKGSWRQSKRPWLLAVEDPQEPGKDIGSGSFNIREVRDVFAATGQQLAEACEDVDAAAGFHPEKVQGGALAAVLDVSAAVGRTGTAVKARRALEQRAVAARAGVSKRRRPLLLGPAKGKNESGKRRGRSNDAGGGQSDRGQKAPAAAPPRGGKFRGSRAGRKVEAQWEDRRGQFLDDPDDFGGGGGRGWGDPTFKAKRKSGKKESKRPKQAAAAAGSSRGGKRKSVGQGGSSSKKARNK